MLKKEEEKNNKKKYFVMSALDVLGVWCGEESDL